MQISVLDKSNYLKGLLVIAKKDNKLTEPEKKIIRNIAIKLGFATDFYEDTLKSLIANKYILDDPIKFSDIKIAESFICDGLKLAYSDGTAPDSELNWLKKIAKSNLIDENWFEERLNHYKNSKHHFSSSDFALYSII
ncbi:MAG TPA: hypothetical protein VKA26_01520 [Ignavibacteriaceae bacterium]|nr:hypothetical protein [Ignavibacteriaceae bacterium]